MNVTNKPQKVRKRLTLGEWLPSKSAEVDILELGDLDKGDIPVPSFIERLRVLVGKQWSSEPVPGEEEIQFGDNLTTEEKEVLVMVLRQFPDVFATGSFKPGTVEGVECVIDTGDTPPICEKRWRYTPDQERVIKNNLKEMLDNDIIEPGNGCSGFRW